MIGSSSAVPRPGRACSSYLVQGDETNIVLDLGTGALQSLSRFLEPSRVSAIVISHFHPDHFMDLVQLRYVVALNEAASAIDVHVPYGVRARLERLAEQLPSGTGKPFFEGALNLAEYTRNSPLQIGEFSLAFAQSRHYIDAYAARVSGASRTFTYSADTAPCKSVTELASNADLFLCEAALGAHGRDRSTRGHSNAREAGRMAHDARVKHLMLTHYSAQCDPEAMRAAAAEQFAGPITIADDGLLLEL